MSGLKKVSNDNITIYLFWLCWLAYFTSYIGRLNYSSAMVYMVGDGVLSASKAGFVSMVYFFAYGIGQLCNGILGDRFHPGKMIFTGLLIASGANLMMGFADSHFLMAVVWGINGYAQAMIWPPIIRIFAEVLEEKKKLKYCVNIVTSQVAGTLGSYLIAALSIRLFGWKSVFVTASFCLGTMAFLWLLGFKKVERYSMKYGYVSERVQEKQKESFHILTFLISTGLIAVVFPDMIHGMLKDGVTSWVPTYISEVFLVSPTVSILITMVLPVITMAGAFMAKYVYDKCGQREFKSAACFFFIAVIGLCGLKVLGSYSMILTILLFACITTSMMAVNTIFINMIPLRFEKFGKVSTVSGFLNAMAYLGTAASTFLIGVLVERFGWQTTINVWIILTFAAFAQCIVFIKKRL